MAILWIMMRVSGYHKPLFFWGFLQPYVEMEGPTPRMKEPAQDTEEDSIME
jgi:hypothetical protein